MAFSQAQIDALDEAIASGTLTVKFADKTVTYDSFEKLVARRNYIATQLGQKASGLNRVYPTVSKGMNGCDR